MTTTSTGVGTVADLKEIAHIACCLADSHDDGEVSWLSEQLRDLIKPIKAVSPIGLILSLIDCDRHEPLKERFAI